MIHPSYEALREHAGWIDLSGRGKIRITGEDRVRLAHALTTNHIEGLAPWSGCYAFFLNSQGRVLGDMNLFKLPEYLLLDTEPEVRPKLYEHFDKLIIADDAALEDVSDTTATVNVEGPRAQAILASLGAPADEPDFALAEWGTHLLARIGSTGLPGYSIFLPLEEKANLLERLDAARVHRADPLAIEAVRLENRVPRYGVDFSEAHIPNQMQQLGALHFSKGCYLGQEIVERVRSLGQVNRLLASLEADTETPFVRGSKILLEGKEVGQIGSSAFSPARGKVLAFAILRREALASGATTVDGVAVRPLSG